MKKLTLSYLGLLAGLASLGLAATGYPGWGYVLSCPAFLLSFFGNFAVNIPLTRVLSWLACVSIAAALYLGSGSAVAALGLLAVTLLQFPNEVTFREFGHKANFTPFGILLALAAMTAPFEMGLWRWAPLPYMAFGVLMTLGGMKDLAGMEKAALGGWRVTMGALVPDVHLFSRDTQTEFQLSRERGRFVLLCFLRGDWCPACHMMMRIYKKEAARLAQHNVKLVAISPSSGADAEGMAKMIGVDYLLLADPDCRAAQMFGAVIPKAFKGNDVPLPASFLVDPDGVLRFASTPENVQAFLDPQIIVNILEARAGLKAA